MTTPLSYCEIDAEQGYFDKGIRNWLIGKQLVVALTARVNCQPPMAVRHGSESGLRGYRQKR
jgi:hypothetical protein